MAIYHNNNLPYFAEFNGEPVDKIYYNGTLVFPHFLYKLMPNFRTAPNSVLPHKINTGIGITRVEAIDPANNIPYWSGEYLEHGYLKQTFNVKTMYNYNPPSESDTTVTWSPNGESTINNSRSNRKKCQPCTMELVGSDLRGYNYNPITVKLTVSYEGYTETITVAPDEFYNISTDSMVNDLSKVDAITWDPLGGYIPAEGYESPNPAPNLKSDAKGEVTVNNNYSYACTHYVVYSPSDPSLKNATVVWSGTLEGTSSYPGNHHTLTNQRSGYYGAFCGDPKYATSPWVGMYLING